MPLSPTVIETTRSIFPIFNLNTRIFPPLLSLPFWRLYRALDLFDLAVLLGFLGTFTLMIYEALPQTRI